MPYRTYNVSTRTLLQMAALFIFMFFVRGVGAAGPGGIVTQPIIAVPNGVNQPATTLPYNAAVPPYVVPSTVISIAGNNHSGAAGYSGDGGFAQGPTPGYTGAPISTVASPSAIAVDSVGNVYFNDTANDVIREINAQTGVINTIAGVTPTGCVNGVCSGHTPYAAGTCSNGVPAAGNPVGSKMYGIAVDGYGNVYFGDEATQTISVIYKGGLRVAQFISLVNNAAAPTPASVVPGNVYFIAGAVSLTGCGGTAGHADAQLPFVNTDTQTTPTGILNNAAAISLDSAGNIYIDDSGNKSIRVINTQTTAQTFYNTVVPPGYIQAVGICGVNTIPCAPTGNLFNANYPQVSTSTVNGVTTNTWLWQYPGIGEPVQTALFSTFAAFIADAWGNSYIANSSSNSFNNAIGVAYTGGPLGHLLNVELETGQEAPTSGGKTNGNYNTAQAVPVAGDFYDAYNQSGAPTTTLNNFPDEQAANGSTDAEIRALAVAVDPFGHIWYSDSHYPSITRIDVNSETIYGIIGSVKQRTATNSGFGDLTSAPTAGQTAYCDSGIKAGPKTWDTAGDNCPGVMAATGGGNGLASDGLGNIYFTDSGTATFTGGTQLIRKLLLGTVFPVTAMAVPSTTTTGYATGWTGQALVAAAPVTQAIQVHFDEWNLPTGLSAGTNLTSKTSPTSNNGFITTAFSIVPGLISPQVTTDTTVGTTNYGNLNPDFAIDTTDPEFPEWWLMGGYADSTTGSIAADYFNTQGVTCVQPALTQGASRLTPLYNTTGYTDWGIDCILNVVFTPQAPGLRTAQLMVTTVQMTPPANGSVSGVGGGTAANNPTSSGVINTYYIPLTGTGYGAQLVVDGAQQALVPNTGLAASGTNAVAVNSAGVVYATDPTNNRVVIVPSATAGYTGSTVNSSKSITVSSTAGLGAGLTISDTGGAIPAGTTIAAVGTGAVTLSAAATSSVASDTFVVAVGPSLSVSAVTSYAQYAISTTATTLNGPLGVAVDAANNIYISDTKNNRILKVNPANTVATLLGNYVWVPGTQVLDMTKSIAACTTPPCSVVYDPSGTTPPPQYAFSAPQGLAVDNNGNVYVADTGNHVVVEIPSNPQLGGAFALLQNTGTSTTITNPVGVSLDQRGNVYVADTGNVKGNIVLIPAGGGDLVGKNFAGNVTNQINTLQGNFISNGSTVQAVAIGGTGIGSPNGVAVDAAGNVYISDSSDGAVWVAPSGGSFGVTPYVLNLPGLKTPSGLAVDQSGNVYVADSGLGQVFYLNRSAPLASFGTVPQNLIAPSGVAGVAWTNNALSSACPVLGLATPCSGVLTVTNIGNAPTLALSSGSPFPITLTGNAAFAINQSSSVSTCLNTTVLAPGATCTVAPTFQPVSDGPQSASLTIAGLPISLTGTTQGTGEQPLVNIVLTPSSPTPAAGSTEVITATVTQPHKPVSIAIPTGWIPTGTVNFSWQITSTSLVSSGTQLCGTGGGTGTAPIGPTSGTSGPVTLNASGIATFTLPGASGSALAPGLRYVINATYTPAVAVPDVYDSYTVAPTPVTINVGPATAEAAYAPSPSFAYGAVPPTLGGTGYSVTPALTTGNSVSWSTTNSAGVLTPLTQCGTSAGVYNITPIFSGPNACGYGIQTAYNSGGTTQATVTETPIPLSSAFVPPTQSAFYGAPSINFNSTLQYSGDACGDGASKLSASFSLTSPPTGVANSQILSVIPPTTTGGAYGTYTVYPTVAGKPITAGDYSISTKLIGNLVLTILPASTQTGISATKPSSVLAGSLSTASYSINASTAIPGGIGTPTGTVLVTDTFTPIINTTPGTSATIPACSIYFAGNTVAPFTGTTAQGSPTITQVSTTTGLSFGMTVVGAGIPAGTTIAGINKAASIITLSSAATASAANVTISSPTVSSMASSFGLAAPYQLTPSTTYEVVTGPGIPASTTLMAVGNGNVTLSNSATATATGVVLIATIPNASPGTLSSAGTLTPAGTNCIQATSLTLLSGSATYAPTNATHGTHYYGFEYGGDSNFNPSLATAATGSGATLAVGGTCYAASCLTIDNADFVLSTTTTTVTVVPGTTPSGNGLPTAVGQNSAAPGSALITIAPLLSETGVINLTCATQNPSYENCSMTPAYVTLGSTSSACPSASGSCYSVLSIWTPATLPLGFNLSTSKVRTSTARTVWAFLPFGVLALCIRRRRKLSKALWMLAAIVAVSVGMSGCGSNQVAMYTPVPTGLQTVTVTATGTGITDQSLLTRTFSIGILIQ